VLDTTVLADVARRAARQAAAYIRSVDRPADPHLWGVKGTSDFVTEVDRTAERLIADTLLEAFPESTVLGEELTPESAPGAPLMWVVDPLDGTTNFLHGHPSHAVSVAAMVDGELTAGVVIDVPRDREFHATAGGGAWCGDRRLHVSRTIAPAHALVGTGFPFKTPDLLPSYLRQFTTILSRTSGIRRAGSAALDLADVAIGRFDAFWELWLAPWDIAAGTLLVRESGGVVTDLAGNHDVVRPGPVVAGNPSLHAWLLEVLKD